MQMNILSTTRAPGARLLPLLCLSMAAATAQTATSRMVTAANNLLGTLSEKQRQAVLFAFKDQEQRQRWSNFPTSFVPRGGIRLKEMNTSKQAAAMALVVAALSQRGFEKVQQIMEGDEVLKKTDHGPGGGQGPGHSLVAVVRLQAVSPDGQQRTSPAHG